MSGPSYYQDDHSVPMPRTSSSSYCSSTSQSPPPFSSLTSFQSVSPPPSPSYSSSMSYSSSSLASHPSPVKHSSTVPSFGLWRWLYRRYIRYIKGPFDLLSKRRVYCLLISLSAFMLISLQLFQHSSLPSQSANNINDKFSLDRRRSDSDLAKSSFPFKLSNFWLLNSGRDRKTATQIDQQLQNIEVRLKENRQILKQIRDKIHLADPGQSESAPDHFLSNVESDFVNEALFYQQQSQSQFCPRTSVPSSQSGPNHLNTSDIYDRLPFDNPDGGVWKQGWKIELPGPEQIRSERLKIFVVPHSHNDPGWIKTFDKYFADQTKPILTGAVEQLNSNPRMKFIWAETSYLSAWWDRAPSDQHRQLMKKLIATGQIEIVTGGWVMNDEANTHYFSILHQMIEGHEWLHDTFGVEPKHGWAIDPFGLSPTMAYLLQAMGFRAMVIQRVHYSIKKYLAQRKQLEFNWRQHWQPESGGNGGDILCHLQPFYSYDIPHTCGPDPKVCCQFDFKRLPPNRVKCPWKINPQPITVANIEERAKLLLDQYRKKAQLYKTNSLLVPLGDDFRYDKPKEWKDQFINYQKLFNFINAHEELNVEIKFATLQDYFDSIFTEHPADSHLEVQSSFEAAEAAQSNFKSNSQPQRFPSLTGDFFTYCDRDDHYWSGYYTSKPFYKRFERILQAHLRATEFLFSFANLLQLPVRSGGGNRTDPFASSISDLIYARQNLALFQHHDGITGTAKDFVVQDYAKRMYRSFTILEQIMSRSIQTIVASRSVGKDDSPKIAPPPPDYKLEFMERFPNEVTPPRKHLFRLNLTSKSHFVLYNSLEWSIERELFCFEISWDQAGPMPSFGLVRLGSSPEMTLVDDIQLNHCWHQERLLSDRKEICFQPKLAPLSLTEFCIGASCNPATPPLVYSKFDLQRFESFVTLYNYQSELSDSGHSDHTVPIDSHVLSMLEVPHNLSIENRHLKLEFDSAGNGMMNSIGIKNNDNNFHRTNFTMQLMLYGTRKGGKNVPKSGAYIFLPDQSEPKLFEPIGRPKIRLTAGRLESRYELLVERPFPVYFRWSLSRQQRSVTLWTEFHLQGLYGANRELLLRFSMPTISNGDRFFTDLNGFQLIGRKRYGKIPIQGNVYPVNTMAFIEHSPQEKDEAEKAHNLRLTLLTGQPLGVTSPRSGSLDLFLDRRLSQDDQRGLNQGVVDNRYTREQFRLLLESPLEPCDFGSPRPTSAAMFESQLLLHRTIGLTRTSETNSQQPSSNLLGPDPAPITFLKRSLPCDLHLLNLRRATKRPDEFALLLHRFGLSCDSACPSNPAAALTIPSIFSNFIVDRLDPTRLTQPGISLLDRTITPLNQKSLNQTLLLVEPMQISAYKIFRKR